MKLWTDKKISQEIEEFTSAEDILLDQLLVKYDVLGSIAHAIMLQKIDILTGEELEKMKLVLLEILTLNEKGKFGISIEDEDVHTKIENYLTQKLGKVGGKIHTARSRNDQILVDLRLYTKEKLLELEGNLLALCGTLIEFAKKNNVSMPGYTHLRKAMPSSVALWSLAFVESLLDDLVLLKTASKLNNQNPLGSGAGYGVPLKIDRQLTTDLLGFEKIQQNVLYVQNSRGKIESIVLSALSQIMVDLNKFANDLILFSTEEFGFFEIPAKLCTGSSIMPQKKNPDILELIRARASKVSAHLFQTIEIIKNLPSGYNRDLQETKEPLIKGLNITNSCLEMCNLIASNLKVNKEKLVKALTPEIFATDQTYELVKKGIPFREAYKKIKKIKQNYGKVSPGIVKKLNERWDLKTETDKLENQVKEELNILKLEKKNFEEKMKALYQK